MSGGTFAAFLDIMRRIPAGKVATYGQIARLAGMPRSARLAGYAAASCRDPSVPSHCLSPIPSRTQQLSSGCDLSEDRGLYTFPSPGTFQCSLSGKPV